ncbi:hypothetical protein U27_01347 [Candidatus Vecturithrix granuli]|uniref:Alginate export domain-containing protein n=1 Tax=Vecturithrix granuli TaxID=1499967 RepID=A0A081CA42_VECG1|nr:hypothetical protein U27_01347 [Candidatus Vecturithrix granuli]
MNKKVLVLVVGLLLLATPVFAAFVDDNDTWKFNMERVRYRFQYFIQSASGDGDTYEFLDDDFDTTWAFSKGELKVWFELEPADSNMGDDTHPNTDWDSVLGNYGAKWTPESLADSSFVFQVGDFGTGFGKAINTDESPRGSVGVSWKMGDVAVVLEYGRKYEGKTDDDVEGDEHLIRGQVHMPLGESGFNLGAYAVLYTGSDIIFSEDVKGDRNVFLGAGEFSGKVSNLDLYSEFGFASGKTDETGEEVDLSGFYIMGGTSVAVGQVTLGIEGGFATGDKNGWEDGKDEGFTAVSSDFWLGQVLHDESLILRSNGKDGGLSNIVYGQVTAGISPTDKLSLDAGVIYLKPAEEIVSPYTGVQADTYGTEVFGSVNYKLADSLKYILYWGYAIVNEDFIEDNQYQLHNRLEFNF